MTKSFFDLMTNEVTYRAAAVLMLLTMMAIRRRTQTRSDQSGNKEAFKKNPVDAWILNVFGVSWSVSVVIYGFAPAWIAWADWDFADWLRWVGVASGLMSLVLLAWSDHHLGVNFSPTLRIRDEHEIVKSGPYHWVRHPIYTAGLMFMIAMFLISSNAFVGFCWSGVIVLYALRIPREEQMMLERFGDEYQQYKNETGLFLPRLFK